MVHADVSADDGSEKSGIDQMDASMIELFRQRGRDDLANEWERVCLSTLQAKADLDAELFPSGCCRECGKPIGLWHGVTCRPLSSDALYHRQQFVYRLHGILQNKLFELRFILARLKDDRSDAPASSDSE